MKMEEIEQDLKLITQAFNLGKLEAWQSEQSEVKDFTIVYFDTSKENNLKYYFKNKK